MFEFTDGTQRRLPGAIQGFRADLAADGALEHYLLPHVRTAQADVLNVDS